MSVWKDDPAAVRPMLASLAEPPLVGHGLVYEQKYDGIRALVDVRPGPRGGAPHVTIYSRNGHDKTRQFPEVHAALSKFAATLKAPLLLDGEIVAVDATGRPLGFQEIQGRIHLAGSAEIARGNAGQPAMLVVFDLLRDGDLDLRGEPFAARRLALQQRMKIRPALTRWLRLSQIVADDGRALLNEARANGWEGLIVKDGQSRYSSGRRTPAWKKLKLLKQQEFVVGGWTAPRLTRQHFGALLIGYYANGALQFAGSVGTGFDEQELARLARLLDARTIAKSPFAGPVKTMETPHWVRPDLVAEVRFTEWTNEGLLRQPVYLGTRDDKKGKDVTRESGPSGPVPGKSMKQKARSTKHGARRPQREARRGPDPKEPTDLTDLILSLEHAKRDGDLVLPSGDVVHVTNLAKVFWPTLGITKGELMRYYVDVAPYVLPVVDDRPLVMKRFPNGIDKPAFYQQRHPERVPPGVRREALPDRIDPIDEPGSRERIIGGSLTTLLYMTQLACISQDPWFSRVADPLSQDHAAIDLDPGDGTTFAHVLDVARWVKDELDRFRIPAVAKTSGASGLHIYIPLPAKTPYDTGQLLCRIIATIVAEKHPKVATVERLVRNRRQGTVYVDFLQNILGKTLATAYSARASDYAGVSTPLSWKEIEHGVDPRDFTVRTAPARFKEIGDLWATLRTRRPVDLQAVLERMK